MAYDEIGGPATKRKNSGTGEGKVWVCKKLSS